MSIRGQKFIAAVVIDNTAFETEVKIIDKLKNKTSMSSNTVETSYLVMINTDVNDLYRHTTIIRPTDIKKSVF